MKKIFIIWGREAELSKQYALSVDAEIKKIYSQRIARHIWLVPFRYLVHGVNTLIMLSREKPDFVMVQNPPIFAVIPVYFYCLLTGSKYAIDSHTVAFIGKKWESFFFLFKFFSKRAIFNSCHNYKNLEILKKWGVSPVMVAPFAFIENDEEKFKKPLKNKNLEKFLNQKKINILMVNRFANDDDWKTVFETAKIFKEANFYITGGADKKTLEKIKKEKVDNFILTDYLEHTEFMKMMRRSDIVIALTLRKDTKLWSIQEALSLNKPFITSDSEVLRHYFREVAQFVKGDPEDMVKKIKYILNNKKEIKEKLKKLTIERKKEYQEEMKKIKNIIEKNAKK